MQLIPARIIAMPLSYVLSPLLRTYLFLLIPYANRSCVYQRWQWHNIIEFNPVFDINRPFHFVFTGTVDLSVALGDSAVLKLTLTRHTEVVK